MFVLKTKRRLLHNIQVISYTSVMCYDFSELKRKIVLSYKNLLISFVTIFPETKLSRYVPPYIKLNLMSERADLELTSLPAFVSNTKHKFVWNFTINQMNNYTALYATYQPI